MTLCIHVPAVVRELMMTGKRIFSGTSSFARVTVALSLVLVAWSGVARADCCMAATFGFLCYPQGTCAYENLNGNTFSKPRTPVYVQFGESTCNAAGCGCDCTELRKDQAAQLTCESVGYISTDNVPTCGKIIIDGPRTRLLRTSDPASVASDAVAECQNHMVEKYDTHSLTTPDQVRAYFDCLDSNENGVLDSGDASFQILEDLRGDGSSMDDSGDDIIQPGELDPMLSTEGWVAASASGGGRGMAVFSGLLGACVAMMQL